MSFIMPIFTPFNQLNPNNMREFKTPKAKFKVDNVVVMKTPTLYGETQGVITRTSRTYQRCDKDGTVERGGLSSMEHMFYIPEDTELRGKPWQSKGNNDITYEFAGPNMIIGRWHRDGVDINRPFYNVCTKTTYLVKTPRILTYYRETSLKLLTIVK